MGLTMSADVRRNMLEIKNARTPWRGVMLHIKEADSDLSAVAQEFELLRTKPLLYDLRGCQFFSKSQI